VLQLAAISGATTIRVTVVTGVFSDAGDVTVGSLTPVAPVGGGAVPATSCAIEDLQVTLSSSPSSEGKVSALYTSATEAVSLNCALDDCTSSPSAAAGTVGYVSCESDLTTCTKLMPAPMLSVALTIKDTPAFAKVVAYMDGQPYPRSGANSFVQTQACGSTSSSTPPLCTAELKVYTLKPDAAHTLNLVLTTESGSPLGIKTKRFIVDYHGGCGADGECSGHGICSDRYTGYCVCFDGYYGSDCADTLDFELDLPEGALASTFAAGSGEMRAPYSYQQL
jgi:hypothetical protein